MRKKFKNMFESRGVSPVIGVILMVAVTVALVALVTVVVFDIGGDVSESPDATVQLENNDGAVEATVLRNENVDSLRVEYEDGTSETIGSTAGSTTTIEEGDGTYTIIAVMSDGSENVLQTKEFTGVNTGTTLSGTVEVNPKISGATVKALDSSDNVLATTTTDSEGKYSFTVSNIDNVQVVVNGFSYDSKELYGTISKDKSSSTVNVDFGDSSNYDSKSVTDIDGDGNDEEIVMSKDSDGYYTIGTVEQLQNIKNTGLDKNYKIVNDIDASATSSWNSGNGFDPIGDTSFSGTLDGQEHKINNFEIDRDKENSVGIIYENSGLIKNIDMVDVNIRGNYGTGSISGDLAGGTLKSISVSGYINGTNEYTGGITGTITSNGKIENVYYNGDIDATVELGGIVGQLEEGSIEYVYYTGSISSNKSTDIIGSIVGENGMFSGGDDASVSYAYSDSSKSLIGYENSNSVIGSNVNKLSESDMIGSSSKTNMDGFDFTNKWTTVENPDDYPELSWQE